MAISPPAGEPTQKGQNRAASRTSHFGEELVRGSNMHCSVGFAILVKVAPIWDCFDAGTQSVSMVGTPVSLMPRSSASRRSGLQRPRRMVMQTAAHGFRMRPASHHVRDAQAHELAARIR
jgi:hypothetical protein